MVVMAHYYHHAEKKKCDTSKYTPSFIAIYLHMHADIIYSYIINYIVAIS